MAVTELSSRERYRIYRVKPLIKQKLQKDNAIKQSWMRKLIKNGMESGFSANFSTGLLQIFSYLFVVIRAAAGALTIGMLFSMLGSFIGFPNHFPVPFLQLKNSLKPQTGSCPR